jgi:hypothetical protein
LLLGIASESNFAFCCIKSTPLSFIPSCVRVPVLSKQTVSIRPA